MITDRAAEPPQAQWEFLRGVLQQEEASRRRILGLETQVATLLASVQRTGHQSQTERRIINDLQSGTQVLSASLKQSESDCAEFLSQLRDLKQNYQTAVTTAQHEQRLRREQHNTMDLVWKSCIRLATFLGNIQHLRDMNTTGDCPQRAFNPNDLILDSKAKEQKIDDLEIYWHERELEVRRSVQGFEEQLAGQELEHGARLKEKDDRITELEEILAVMDGLQSEDMSVMRTRRSRERRSCKVKKRGGSVPN